MPQPAKWEEEFDKVFPREKHNAGYTFELATPNGSGADLHDARKYLKQFISSLLDAERKRLREAIEKSRDNGDKCDLGCVGMKFCNYHQAKLHGQLDALAAFDRVAGEV